MSVTCGFYNALNHDRLYDAIQVSSIFDGIINDGVYATYGDHLMVRAAGTDMTVTVGTGRAWFNHSWTLNDAILRLTVPLADLLLTRIDCVVLEVNSSIETRNNSIYVIAGTPGTNPERPTLINNEEIHQYPLAYIEVNPEVTSIGQEKITNMIGTSACPFVTGIIDTIQTDDLILQWEAQFEKFMLKLSNNQQAMWNELNAWFNNLRVILDGNVATNLQNQIDYMLDNLSRVNYDFASNFEYAVGESVIWQGIRYRVIAPIQIGDNFTPGTNIVKEHAMTHFYKSDVSKVFTLNVNNWPAATEVNPYDNKPYYIYRLAVTEFNSNSLIYKVSGATLGSFPTETQREEFSLIVDAVGKYEQKQIWFYAEDKPTGDIFVTIKGVE